MTEDQVALIANELIQINKSLDDIGILLFILIVAIGIGNIMLSK